MKFLKLILAVLIIVLGAGIGWYLADSSNPYKPEKIAAAAATPTVAAAAAPRQANTPIPTFTPATGAGAGNPTTPGAATGTNPGAGGARTGGAGGQVVTGTVEAYDEGAKTLTVKTAAGQSIKVGAANAAVSKTEKVSSEDFAKSLSANSIVLLAGEKGGDGAYNAKSLTAVDITSMLGGRAGAPGGAGAAGGTPGANAGGAQGGNRGAGAGAGAQPGGGNFTGGGGAGAGAGGRFALPGMNGVVVRGGTLSGTKFSGNTIQGEAITANLSDSTSLLKQVSGTAADLKPGMAITLTAPAAQGGAQAEATLITITDAVAG